MHGPIEFVIIEFDCKWNISSVYVAKPSCAKVKCSCDLKTKGHSFQFWPFLKRPFKVRNIFKFAKGCRRQFHQHFTRKFFSDIFVPKIFRAKTKLEKSCSKHFRTKNYGIKCWWNCHTPYQTYHCIECWCLFIQEKYKFEK